MTAAATDKFERYEAPEAPPLEVSPFLRDWINERRIYPWEGHVSGEVPARDLYERYVAAATAADKAVVTHIVFGAAVVALGITRERTAEGNVYRGLFERTRLEEAQAAVTASLSEPVLHRLNAEAEADHMARISHTIVRRVTRDQVGQYAAPYRVEETTEVPCTHTMPQPVIESIGDQVKAHVDGLIADGTVERMVEERFGPYLRWQEGEPDPGIAIRRERDEDRLRTLWREFHEADRTYTRLQAKADRARADWLLLRDEEIEAAGGWEVHDDPNGALSFLPRGYQSSPACTALYLEWVALTHDDGQSYRPSRPALELAEERVQKLDAAIAALIAKLYPEPTSVQKDDDDW